MDHRPDPAHVTRLLQDCQRGSRHTLDQLVPLVYSELCALASRQLAHEWRHDRPDIAAVVTEAYLRLLDQREVAWQNGDHFLAIASQTMRRVLADDGRRRTRLKRGGVQVPADFEEALAVPAEPPLDVADLLDLDRALARLDALDPGRARVVELRFFAGLTIDETAAALSLSPTTVKREWAAARAWLYCELAGAAHRWGRPAPGGTRRAS